MGMTAAPKYISLFSGCGGLDLGFSRAGYVGHLSIDIDDAAIAVHRENLGSPVQKIDLSQSELDGVNIEDLDVLLAGSPCQGFSTAGNRRVDDPRNSLLLVAPRIASKYRPKVVVAENVPGALVGEHRA